MIKKIFLFQTFLMLCTVSFAQNIKVIGNIPKTDTGKMYQLQIGAYRLAINVNKAVDILTRNGFTAQCEKKGDLVRVFVVVKAVDVRSAVERLGRAGFKEVVIRVYAGKVDDTTPAVTPPTVKPPEVKPAETKPEEPEESKEEPEEPAIVPPAEEEEVWEEAEDDESDDLELEELEEYEDIEDYEEPYEIPVIETEEPDHDLMHLYEGE